MKRLAVAALAALTLNACGTVSEAPPVPPAARAGWTAVGTWTDACCCKVPCPCFFGTGPTEGYCEGASVIEIESGQHGGVRLDGLAAVVTYHIGGWSSVQVSDEASDEQVAAFGALAPELLPYLRKGAEPLVAAASLDVRRGDGLIRYSSPQTSVELVRVESASGEPIVLQNLPAKGTPFPATHGHTQYKSAHLRHDSELGSFEHTGRNGFSSRFELSGS